MKRTLAALLSVLMLMSTFVMLGTNASAAPATEGIFTYVVDNGEAKITAVDENVTGTIVLPATLGGYPVTTVGQNAFLGCRSFDKLVISENIKKLERRAFSGCAGLTHIVVPATVGSLSAGYAFSECDNLYSITIPKAITQLGDFTFDECFNLTHIWYEGSEADRAKMEIHGTDDAILSKATWHYNSCAGEHTIPSTTLVREASCTEIGLAKGNCTACGHEVMVPSSTTPHTVENYKAKIKATCTRNGSEVGTCVECEQELTRAVPASGHAFGEAVVTKEATTTETGVKTKTCANCGETEEEEIPVLTEEPKDDAPSSPVGLIIGIVAAVAVIAVVVVVVLKKKKA